MKQNNNTNKPLFSKRELTEEVIDEMRYIEDTLLPKLESLLERAEQLNQNIEKRIEYALENNPHGIDFKYDVRFVKYALLTDLESIKDVLHVARKLDDRDFIVWIFNQVNMIKPEWSKDLKLGSVPFMKENDEAMRRFNEISSKTIKERYPKAAE